MVPYLYTCPDQSPKAAASVDVYISRTHILSEIEVFVGRNRKYPLVPGFKGRDAIQYLVDVDGGGVVRGSHRISQRCVHAFAFDLIRIRETASSASGGFQDCDCG
jgi:hypothetical protein